VRDGEWVDKDEVGRIGELLAAKHLRSCGFKVLHCNFRAVEGGEIDIICRDDDILAFVEVKARTSLAYGRPIDAVTMDKRFLIARGAMAWLRLLDHPEGSINYRFDVVEVMLADGQPPDFNLVKGAFETPEPFLYG
jgi:putative endonuclease